MWQLIRPPLYAMGDFLSTLIIYGKFCEQINLPRRRLTIGANDPPPALFCDGDWDGNLIICLSNYKIIFEINCRLSSTFGRYSS